MPACQVLGACEAPPGRMQVLGGGALPLAIVDYAHTPDALDNALRAARAHCAGRLLCVFGCGGDRDRGKRAPMGQAAESLADELFITDDNPRSEDPARIVADILGGLRHPERAQVAARSRARDRARRSHSARAGDVVLVAGKGHEDYQINGRRAARVQRPCAGARGACLVERRVKRSLAHFAAVCGGTPARAPTPSLPTC